MLQMNAVDIMQQVSVSGERSSVRAGIRNQTVQLLNTPVTDCALWVSELSETPLSELQELYRAERENVRTVSGDDGLPAEWWVRWQRVESLASCGPEDRCYELDCTTGRITFGDGVNGRIPAYSAEIQVSADYSWGGGVSGNLPAGAIDGLSGISAGELTEKDGVLSARSDCQGARCTVTIDKATGDILSVRSPSNKLSVYFSDVSPYTADSATVE